MITNMKRGARYAYISTASVLVMALAATPVWAQDDAPSAKDERLAKNIIVVTATKREQTLQDTPVAVSVVSGATIEQAAIQDILDLQSLVPSFSASQRLASTSTSFFIRGFGNGLSAVGLEPSVGVFVDGVYRSRSGAALADFPRLERVEVLRGPQTTLFGKNASAGVVSFISKKPEFEWGGSVEGTYGNYDAVRLGGDITGPISDTVAFSLSGRYNKRDGYAQNLTTGGDLNNRNRWGIRGQLLWEPSDQTSVRLIGDLDDISEDCCISANLFAGGSPTGTFSTRGAFSTFGDVVIEDPFSYTVFANIDNEAKLETGGISLHVDHELNDILLTSISAYRNVDFASRTDSDGTSLDVVNAVNDGSLKTFTQEVRLTSNYDASPVDWMIGAFYFSEKVKSNSNPTFPSDSRLFYDLALGGNGGGATVAFIEGRLGLPAGSIGEVGRGSNDSFTQDNDAFSVFGTFDWHVTDQLDFTVGLNWSKDSKDVTLSSVNTDLFSLLPAAALGGAAALQFFPVLQPVPNSAEDGRSRDDKLTYTLRAAYEVTDNLNVYASYSTGWKATSWNLSRESRPTATDRAALIAAGEAVINLQPGTRFAEPENSRVLEFGMKGTLFDRLVFDLTLFDQSIKDFQSNTFDGQNVVLSNAGKQSTKGIEVDANLEVTDELTFGFAATILDPVYTDFSTSPFGDLSGTRPAGIPTWSTSTRIGYQKQINDWRIYARADYQYTSGTALTDDPATQALIDATGFDTASHQVNGSLGFTTPGDIDVTFWGRNIFNDKFITGGFGCPLQFGSVCGYPNEPRTYGMTVRKRF